MNKNWITEGIIIALVPFLGYLFAFAYESGHAIFFNFPTELIDIGLTQIMTTILILYSVATALFFLRELLSFIFSKNKTILYQIILMLPSLGLSIGYWGTYGWRQALPFIITFVILGFYVFIFPLITQRDKKDYDSKLLAAYESTYKLSDEQQLFSTHLIKIFGLKNILLVANIFFCVFYTNDRTICSF